MSNGSSCRWEYYNNKYLKKILLREKQMTKEHGILRTHSKLSLKDAMHSMHSGFSSTNLQANGNGQSLLRLISNWSVSSFQDQWVKYLLWIYTALTKWDMLTAFPQCSFPPKHSAILSENLICDHWLIVPKYSGIMHCGILFDMPYWFTHFFAQVLCGLLVLFLWCCGDTTWPVRGRSAETYLMRI